MKTALPFLAPLFIFILQFYPKIVICSTEDSHYVMHNCEKSNDTYITGGPFQSTLNDALFSILPAKALQSTFYNFTSGTGIDQVYALFYCRGDVDALACQECVLAAADKVIEQCQFLKEAIVWFEECTLRYANRNFFSIDEEDPLHIYTNKTGIMNDYFLDPFKKEFDSAMGKLIHQAVSLRNLQGFATTEVNLSSTEVLHCAVQCTPDISGAYCERCLKSALNQRDKWADTIIFMPSCFIRIDLYNSTTPPISIDPNSNGRSSKKHFPLIKIVVISVACVIVFAILAVVYCYIRYWPDSPPDLPLPAGDTPRPRKFTYIQLAVATNGFIRLNYLGKGGFGCVYKGILRGQKVAVKRLIYGKRESRQQQQQNMDEFDSEVRNNFNAVHNNIVRVVGYCNQRNHKMIVYELVENNSLHKHLLDNKHGNLTWERRMNIAICCSRGLEYLHGGDRRIIHRDIKPSNILLDSNYEPKLADFGLSRVFPGGVSYVRTHWRGTYGYVDPEYFQHNRLTLKSDVYSFGIVLLQLIVGMSPRAWDYDPGYILWLLLQDLRHFTFGGPEDSETAGLQDLRHFAFDCLNDTATVDPRVSASDGLNHSARHGKRDSSSDGRYDSASENLHVAADDPKDSTSDCPGNFLSENSKGSTSKCPENILSERLKGFTSECPEIILSERLKGSTSKCPEIVSSEDQECPENLTSERLKGSTSKRPKILLSDYSEGSTSQCPEIVSSEDQKEPILECPVNLLPGDPRSPISKLPNNLLSEDTQCSTSKATKNPTSNGPEYIYLDTYVDPKLEKNYNMEQMVRMIICAAMCVHPSRHYRLGMSQVVKLLEEGNVVANDDDVARIITHTGAVGNDPQHPDKLLELDDLKQLATLLLEGLPPNSIPMEALP